MTDVTGVPESGIRLSMIIAIHIELQTPLQL